MTPSTYLHNTSKRHPFGLLVVVLLHALLFWLLQSGLIQVAIRKSPPLIQAVLLFEDRPAPPATEPPPPKLKATPPPAPQPAPQPLARPAAAPTEVQASTSQPSATAVSAAPAAAPAAPSAPAMASATAKPAPTGIKTAASVNTALCEKPVYPIASRRLEEEGAVALRFLIGTDGKVIQSEIEKSSGFKRLDEAARAGLSKCLFHPATLDGKAEQAWARMVYEWTLTMH